ncbi:MAG: hypothetical protein ACOCWQ_03835 [Nanoarchaeota archaeon]
MIDSSFAHETYTVVAECGRGLNPAHDLERYGTLQYQEFKGEFPQATWLRGLAL